VLLVGGLVLLVAGAGAVVLGLLLTGLWRRARGLLAELGELGDRLERVRDEAATVSRPRAADGDLGTTLGAPGSADAGAPGCPRL
jgi:hypothetical protein